MNQLLKLQFLSIIPDVVLGVDITGHIEGVGTEETEELLKLTHKTCPYSRATQGNIEVTIKAI